MTGDFQINCCSAHLHQFRGSTHTDLPWPFCQMPALSSRAISARCGSGTSCSRNTSWLWTPGCPPPSAFVWEGASSSPELHPLAPHRCCWGFHHHWKTNTDRLNTLRLPKATWILSSSSATTQTCSTPRRYLWGRSCSSVSPLLSGRLQNRLPTLAEGTSFTQHSCHPNPTAMERKAENEYGQESCAFSPLGGDQRIQKDLFLYLPLRFWLFSIYQVPRAGALIKQLILNVHQYSQQCVYGFTTCRTRDTSDSFLLVAAFDKNFALQCPVSLLKSELLPQRPRVQSNASLQPVGAVVLTSRWFITAHVEQHHVDKEQFFPKKGGWEGGLLSEHPPGCTLGVHWSHVSLTTIRSAGPEGLRY